MKKFVVTWTFMRHIYRQRQYKILTKIFEAESEHMAEFYMLRNEEVQALFKEKYDHKLKSYTEISGHLPAEEVDIDKKALTFRESNEKHKVDYPGGDYTMNDRQNTFWSKNIMDKCNHNWQPVQMVLETAGYQPDLTNGKVYCVCMKCCAWTYILTGWTGYFLNSPDLMEDALKYPEV